MFKSKNAVNAFLLDCASSSLALSKDYASKMAQVQYKSPKWTELEKLVSKYETKHNWIALFLIDNDSASSLLWKMEEDQLLKLINASYSLEKVASIAGALKSKNAGCCLDDVTLQALSILNETEWKKSFTVQTLRLKTKKDDYKKFHAGTQQNYILNVLERIGVMRASRVGQEKLYTPIADHPIALELQKINFVNPAK